MSNAAAVPVRRTWPTAPQGTLRRVALLAGLISGFGSTSASLGAPPAPFQSASSGVDTRIVTAWPGDYGGLPPYDRIAAPALEAAFRQAVESKRAEVRAIADNPQPATFENTVAALDASGTELLRTEHILQEYSATASSDEIRAISARVLPLGAALDDEIAFNDRLYARVAAVHAGLPGSAPTPEARRLVQVMYEDMRRRGATLNPQARSRLQEINARLAKLTSEFGQNLAREEETLVVFVSDAAELRGLPDDRIAAAKAAATARGKPDQWAIPISRPAVWPLLTRVESRPLRERVFKLWDTRGDNRGPYDNAPITSEILLLRGEKARLLGYPTYAHYAASSRMAGTPDKPERMLLDAWRALLPVTQSYLAKLQSVAKAEGQTFELEPWDRLYYAEKYRQQAFGFDSESVRPYLSLQNVMDGMTWAAERVYGLKLREIQGVPTLAPEIRVYEVLRGPKVAGILYVDLFQRKGKGPASWASELRPAARGEAEVLPVAALHSNVVPTTDGSMPLLEWERANVIFHEFGHAMHVIANGARYRALGSMQVPYDFIETPSLLQERWLLDRTMLKRFMRHHQTGAEMPDELIAKIEAVQRNDRVFSMNLDYLATAIVDLRMHRLADGRPVSAMDVERATIAELGTPHAVTPLLRMSSAWHPFTEMYGSAIYTYFWSDALAADIAEKFLTAPGGLYDPGVSELYRRTILEGGNTQPIEDAFRQFRGRDPDPDALFRRFGLEP